MLYFLLIIQLLILYYYNIKSNYNYSSFSTFIVFWLIFYILVPVITIYLDISFWGFKLDDYLYTFAAFINTVFLIFFCITYQFFKRVKVSYSTSIRLADKNYILLYFVLFFVFILQLYLSNFSFLSLFLRDYDDPLIDKKITLPSLFWMINMTSIKIFPIITYLLLSVYSKENFTTKHKIIMILFCLIIASPLVLPRYLAACFYISILYVEGIFNRFLKYKYLLICAILLLFPIFDLVRNIDLLMNNSFTSLLQFILISNIKSGHLDAFQSVMMAVKSDYISLGEQLVGNLLFFIPRDIWIAKPESSAILLANMNQLDYTNISLSFIGEGFINFSLVGVIIFAISLGAFLSYYDKKLRIRSNVFSIMLVPLVVIIMRGDLITAVSTTIGIITGIIFWSPIIKYLIK
jgi:hypothetical protein